MFKRFSYIPFHVALSERWEDFTILMILFDSSHIIVIVTSIILIFAMVWWL